WQHAPLAEIGAPALVEIFSDDRGAGNGGRTFLHQHRRGAGRIEGEELLTPFPNPLLHHLSGNAVLGQRQAHESRVRAEWMMEQRRHSAVRMAPIASAAGEGSEGGHVTLRPRL